MNYLSEHNSIVWLIFIIYAVTALLILPDFISGRQMPKSAEEHNERAGRFCFEVFDPNRPDFSYAYFTQVQYLDAI